MKRGNFEYFFLQMFFDKNWTYLLKACCQGKENFVPKNFDKKLTSFQLILFNIKIFFSRHGKYISKEFPYLKLCLD